VTTTVRCFVLVPGAGGSAWYWHRLVPELARRGHDAIAVELPGGDESADLPDYVDAVVAATGDRPDVVMVGQSLGGFTAVLACQRLAVSRLVLVNAMIPNPGETPGEWWANTEQSAAMAAMDRREGRAPDAGFDPFVHFLHDVPAEVMDTAESAPEQANRPFGTPADFERWPDVPTHVLVGRDDRFFPADFQRRVARERLGLEADLVPGGHLVALAHPVELAERLTAYVEQ
jgi:pimeloyl-ACP methyl ester carboxylesterase